jgi:PucR family transcriptional regulator, purine catabolism regulatory protein
MTFTVQDALKVGPLRFARVLAGGDGLNRPLSYVNVMEVPDILKWVKRDELLLTTLYPMRDMTISPGELVRELSQRHLAGIAVKIGRYVDGIPDEMIEAADRERLPLLELQADVSFNDIINSLLAEILNAQANRLRHSQDVHQRFTEIVLAGGGLGEIAENLSTLIQNPILIVGPERRVLAAAESIESNGLFAQLISKHGDHQQLEASELGDSAKSAKAATTRRTLHVGSESIACAVRPIRVGASLYGSIIAVLSNQDLNDGMVMAIDHAATVAAIDIMKQHAILNVERRFQADFLDDLLSGRIQSQEAVSARANALAWNLDRPALVMVIAFHHAGQDPAQRWRNHGSFRRDGVRLIDLARTTLQKLDHSAILWERSDSLVALLGEPCARQNQPALVRQASMQFAKQINEDLHIAGGEGCSTIGVGRAYSDPLKLHLSYEEARQALTIGAKVWGSGAVTHFEDLGVYRILHHHADKAELDSFAEEILGKLIEYDRKRNTDLVATLDMLLDCNLNISVAARRLYLHYNSLRYRLQKIEELIGPFVDDAHQRFNLQFALRIRKARQL